MLRHRRARREPAARPPRSTDPRESMHYAIRDRTSPFAALIETVEIGKRVMYQKKDLADERRKL